jgi:hypothetical protein
MKYMAPKITTMKMIMDMPPPAAPAGAAWAITKGNGRLI